jgi:hypothetical protein
MLGSCLHHLLQVVIRGNDLLLRETRHTFRHFLKGTRLVPATDDLRNIPFILLVGRCEVFRLPLLTALSPLPFPAEVLSDLLESLRHLVESVELTR